MKSVIRRPTLLDTFFLAKNARKADIEESSMLSGREMLDVFNQAHNLYLNSWVWEINGKLACMYGISPYDEKSGVIWFIATDEFDKHKMKVSRGCREVYEQLIDGYEYLFNYVHVRHKKALRWLKWLGVDILDAEPIGKNGEMFCKFEVKNV